MTSERDGMSAAELIERLKQLPPDTRVVVSDDNGGACGAHFVEFVEQNRDVIIF